MLRSLVLASVVGAAAAAAASVGSAVPRGAGSAASATAASASKMLEATALWDPTTQRTSLLPGQFTPSAPNAVAAGQFNDTVLEVGWGILRVHTIRGGDDLAQMRGAGMVEGWTTRHRIVQQYENMYDFFWPKKENKAPPKELTEWLVKQEAWTQQMIEKYAFGGGSHEDAAFWGGVAMIMAQFEGLYEGYNEGARLQKDVPHLPRFAFQLLNGVGDFLTLLPALNAEPGRRPDFGKMSAKEVEAWVGRHGMCSAMIKLTGSLEHLVAGHSSWFTFASTNRIYKYYLFDGLAAPYVRGHRLAFSSYPGFLESLDDFYLASSGLQMVQTTNSIFNEDLYAKIQPHTLWAWQRVRLSMLLADSGEQWGNVMGRYNSGTYQNQYMVVDYKKFHKGERVDEGALYVVEQIPGLSISRDQTAQLERGYWSSYNVPFYKEIYEQSGYPAMVKQHGVRLSYQMAPRAQIFRRDAGKVKDLQGLKDILRYNDYENDPVSEGNPGAAICSRFDLVKGDPQPFGCYDTKVSSNEHIATLSAEIINGPTRSHGLPAFDWTEFGGVFNSTVHEGTPTKYEFDFINTSP